MEYDAVVVDPAQMLLTVTHAAHLLAHLIVKVDELLWVRRLWHVLGQQLLLLECARKAQIVVAVLAGEEEQLSIGNLQVTHVAVPIVKVRVLAQLVLTHGALHLLDVETLDVLVAGSGLAGVNTFFMLLAHAKQLIFDGIEAVVIENAFCIITSILCVAPFTLWLELGALYIAVVFNMVLAYTEATTVGTRD